tara:strand:+ start:163 stop:300 length:138 start_codon:yes stop_codon:yes gene_type:complete
MDTFKVMVISFGNYAIGLSQTHELLQIVVAMLSIVLLIMNIKGRK